METIKYQSATGYFAVGRDSQSFRLRRGKKPNELTSKSALISLRTKAGLPHLVEPQKEGTGLWNR